MTDLEFLELVRGPALWTSLVILVAGSLWRIVGVVLLGAKPDHSEPRSTRLVAGAIHGILSRMIRRKEFQNIGSLGAWNGYAYHLGLAVIVFGYLPHIQFVEHLTGLAWPALPGPVVYVAVGITFVSMFVALAARLTDPVKRILSGFDDYFSWAVVFLPLVTGMAVIYQSGAQDSVAAPLYPMPIAIHLLSVELLLVWLPFGRLGHAFLVFFSRGVTGASLARKGAAI